MADDSGPPPLVLTLEIAVQVLEALSYLHRKGYVHRDIAPDNAMLTRDFEGKPLVKLIDLGIAKRLGGEGGLTSTGMFMGKARYASPEQFSQKEMDQRSDLYSFGVLLYELLTGTCPIEGSTLSQLIAGHLFHPPQDFRDTDPSGRVAPELRRTVTRALAKDPAARMSSAEEFIELLRPSRRTLGAPDPAELEATLQMIRREAVLEAGMQLEGRVSNVTNFGAFVDIGVKRDGLVHLSELSDQWVDDPKTVVKVGQVVKVRVIEVDMGRKRVSLSMKSPDEGQGDRPTKPKSKSGGPKGGPPRDGGGPRRGSGGPRGGKPQGPATVEDLMQKFNRRK